MSVLFSLKYLLVIVVCGLIGDCLLACTQIARTRYCAYSIFFPAFFVCLLFEGIKHFCCSCMFVNLCSVFHFETLLAKRLGEVLSFILGLFCLYGCPCLIHGSIEIKKRWSGFVRLCSVLYL